MCHFLSRSPMGDGSNFFRRGFKPRARHGASSTTGELLKQRQLRPAMTSLACPVPRDRQSVLTLCTSFRLYSFFGGLPKKPRRIWLGPFEDRNWLGSGTEEVCMALLQACIQLSEWHAPERLCKGRLHLLHGELEEADRSRGRGA